jgi:hypothetical protein
MSLDKSVIQRSRSGANIGVPQVLVNYARSSRGPWRMCAAVDHNGLAFTSSILAIRPVDMETRLEAIAAILNGPVANAYLYSMCEERSNSYPAVQSIPIPSLQDELVRDIETAVRLFQEAVSQKEPFERQPSSDELRMLLARIDALVLELYDLPNGLRNKLLRLFEGRKRPGVSFDYELSEELLKAALRMKLSEKQPKNPWSRFAGMWANDPTRDDFIARLAKIRECARG